MILYIPAIVSLWFLILLWRERELFGWQAVGAFAWFLVAVLLQWFGRSWSVGLAGFLAQVALAIALAIKDSYDSVY